MFEKVPETLKKHDQWVCWVDGKIPVQANGDPASTADKTTWTSFEIASAACVDRPELLGIGFVFTDDDPFIGVDFDGCRSTETGKFEQWARDWVLKLDSYSELSPSETGCKVIVSGENPFKTGKKFDIDAEKVSKKQPGIEIYSTGRYFTITGRTLAGTSQAVRDATETLEAIKAQYEVKPAYVKRMAASGAVVDRARLYVAKMEPAIAGQSGHNATFKVACVLVLGFGLGEADAMAILSEYNQRCDPMWNDRELAHKVKSAFSQSGERNYLTNKSQEDWATVEIPSYRIPPTESREIEVTTFESAARAAVEKLSETGESFIETGLPELDFSLGGGLEQGELVVMAARPSHGKSAVAMQMIHHATANLMPCLMISEEMGESAIGTRIISYATSITRSEWGKSQSEITDHLDSHFEKRARCFVAGGCGTIARVVEQIEKNVAENNVKLVVVDYAQLIKGKGNSKYEQVSDVSMEMAKASKRLNVIIVMLCQLNREIENRQSFVPTTADLRDSGQIEQDADVIVFLVWPHKKQPTEDPERYQMFVAKNRNREIKRHVIECRFNPSRQMLLGQKIEDHPRYNKEFSDWNQTYD